VRVENIDVTDESYDWFGTRTSSPAGPTLHPVGPTDRPATPPVRGSAIQPLNRARLVARSVEISSSSFITIVSIMQGVAMAILADQTFNHRSPLVYAQSITLLLVLICVFYTYVNVSIMLRWAPSFLDSFVPFAIAGLEIPPAYFLGRVGAWNTLLAALWLGASCGFFVTIKWSPADQFGEEVEAHQLFHGLLRQLVAMAGACGVLMGALGLLAHLFPAGRLWWGAAGVSVVLATASALVARTEVASSRIHRRFGIERPPFN
jgi:hypothetical protein